MTSFRNLHPQKSSVCERVQLLSQKISSIPLVKPSDTAKKYEMMDAMCDELQSQLSEMGLFVDQKMADILHITSKISKQIKKDYSSIDNIICEEISNSNERMMLLIEQQHEARKQSDLKIFGYIDGESNFIKEAIEQQAFKREEQGNCIRESLEADIYEITKVLDQTNAQHTAKLKIAENDLVGKVDMIGANLREICSTYSDNEAEFYKMLRDLVKKVKGELEEHKNKRENTEAQILNLIQKMCDRAISEKNM